MKKKIITVVGGDGAMYRAIHAQSLNDLQNQVFYGINKGNKGFLMNPTLGEINHIKMVHFPIFLAKITTASYEKEVFFVNDIVIRSGTGRTIFAGVGKRLIQGDGMIVASAIGSYGYNASARGKILTPFSKNYVITALIPCTPIKDISHIHKYDKTPLLTCEPRKLGKINIYADGIEKCINILEKTTISIQYMKKYVTLGFDKEYFPIWKGMVKGEKIKWSKHYGKIG